MRDRQLLDKTVGVFAEQFGVEVSTDDARSAIANVAGFFAILAEWESRDETRGQPAGSTAILPTDVTVSEETPSPDPNPPVETSPKEGES